MGYSKAEILNLALVKLGKESIADPDENSPPANELRRIYDITRDALLRAHPWAFATKRQELAQSATTPDFEYDYQYPVPADFLKVLELYNSDSEYRLEDGNILIDDSTVYLRYTAQITAEAKFDVHFCHALALSLAYREYPRLGNRRVASLQDIANDLSDTLAEAYRSNAILKDPKFMTKVDDLSWVTEGR